ncbi:MAG: M48 family metalloprotease [Alphaproteobacteria bacterium]|nr:M48 family metalloprotease [Alphaproteobacteria bacterium]
MSLLGLLASCAQPTLSVPTASQAEIEQEKRTQYSLLLDAMRASPDYAKAVRLADVAYPLLATASAFCPKEDSAFYGIVWFDPTGRDSTTGALGDAGSRFTLADGLRPLLVVRNTPADKAGITPDNHIIALDGVAVAGRDIAAVLKEYDAKAKRGGALTLTLATRSENTKRDVTLNAVRICNYVPVLKKSDELNAYADGARMVLTTRMVNFAEKDEELAVVVSHEISHNLLMHQRKAMGNALLGAMVDALVTGATGTNTHGAFSQAGARAYSQDFESEADYMGLYLMANTGFSIDGTAHLWRRMAIENPQTIGKSFASTHPSTPERFLTLEHTVAEIHDKQSRRLPLVPNQRSSR